MAWVDVKEAIKTMLSSDGFAVYGSDKISRSTPEYVRVVADEEGNDDLPNNIGSNQFRNTRDFVIWCFRKSSLSSVNLDNVREAAKDQFESEMLPSIKDLFSSCYNAAGDAGAIMIQYEGMNFVDIEKEGIYAPVRMEVRFTCTYIESRNIT